jgi:Cu/Ag efflux pump CusA
VAVILLLFLFDAYAAQSRSRPFRSRCSRPRSCWNFSGSASTPSTLGGLAIALGEVVDDAIIDVENIARRLRENRRRADPRRDADVVIDASLEVRTSVVYATFV